MSQQGTPESDDTTQVEGSATSNARRTALIAIIVGVVVIGLGVAVVLLLVNRGGSGGGASPTPTATVPTTRPAPCPTGDATTPPEVERMTLDGQPAEAFAGSLLVPYAGLDMPSTPDRPVVVKVEVVTSTSGSPVTFSADGGQLVEDIRARWLDAPSTVKVISQPGTDRCLATAYLFSTGVGTVTVEVDGATTTLTQSIPVVTTLQAARNLKLTTTEDIVSAGDPVTANVKVTDVFGNSVESALVDVELPADGTARFANGANTTTIKTGSKGKASVQIQTVAKKADGFTIEASGDQQSCSATSNSYSCAADQPVVGFAAASGPRKTRVDLQAPSVDVTEPLPGDKFTEGELFNVRASTVAVPDGTNVQLLFGDAVVASGATAPDGRIELLDVPARVTGDRNYRLVVGNNLASANLDIRVSAAPTPTPTPTPTPVGSFGIVSYDLSAERLVFSIDPGPFPTGTTVIILRDGEEADRVKIPEGGRPFDATIPPREGVYQVKVETPDGPVYGKDDILVN